MDPVSQGALGAVVVQACVGHKLGRHAWLIGAAAGMAPDLDVVFQSASDPLFSLVMHRHFTHSLAFVPFGGAIAALPFLAWRAFRDKWQAVLVAGIIGFATHAPLDCGTSYGTQYWLPFSNVRVALDFIPIIDPLYTLPLVAAVFWAARTWTRPPSWGSGRRLAALALAISTLYLSLGAVQRARAADVVGRLAKERGHAVERASLLPLPLTNVLWVSVYRVGDEAFHDSVVVPWLGASSAIEGGRITLVPEDAEPPGRWRGSADAQYALETWQWFSQGWLVVRQTEPALVLCDARHSMSMKKFAPIFCISVDEHGINPRYQDSTRDPTTLWQEMTKHDPRQRVP